MRQKNSISSSIVFFMGIAVGLSLAVVSIWADYEAVGYFFTGARFDAFPGMKCPILATQSETITISASIENPGDRPVQPFYRVEVSGPMGRTFRDQILIPPHETKMAEWTVSRDDVDLRYFIMTKITLLPFAGTQAREATCGIFVLKLDGPTGKQVLIFSFAISLMGIILGLSLWERQMAVVKKGARQPQHVRRALGLVVLSAMFSTLMGWWFAGFVLCVLAILLLVITLFVSASA
jgi:hypothetical protein